MTEGNTISKKKIKLDQALTSSGCLSQPALIHFAHNELDTESARIVEHHLRTCEFCKEALEGMKHLPTSAYSTGVLNGLNDKIGERTGKPVSKRVFLEARRLLAAAAILVLLGGSVFFILDKINLSENGQIAEEKARPAKQTAQHDGKSGGQVWTLPENLTRAASDSISSLSIGEAGMAGTATGIQQSHGYFQPENPGKQIAAGNVLLNDISKPVSDDFIAANQERKKAEDRTDRLNNSFKKDKVVLEEKEIEMEPEADLDLAEVKGQPYQPAFSRSDDTESESLKGATTLSFSGQVASVEPTSKKSKKVLTVDGITDGPLTKVEEMPEFPGGQSAFYSFLAENLKHPKRAANKNIDGTVYVSFVVGVNGKLSAIKVQEGVQRDLDRAAVSVIGKMPPWTPGKQGGQNVPVQMTLPVKFELGE